VCHASRLRDGDGALGNTALVIEPAQASEIAPIITQAYELSRREQEITQLIARGLSTADMAAWLHLSAHTVRDYVKAIFEKVRVSSRGELVAKLFAEHYAPAHMARRASRTPTTEGRGARAATVTGMSTSLAARHRGLIALSARESHRVLKLWTQTVAAPILSSFLFILVFGLSLGSRIKQIDGVDYEVFIVPGLIAMAMIQATYANNSASVFQARFDRYLNDVLAAPMRPWEVNLALSIGGIVRALLIGGGLLACALAVVDVPVRHPLELLLAVTLALVLFSSFGVIVGVYANSWDHTAFVTNIVILPLTFLGGVFYSVDRLPAPWHEISHANPIFYLLNAVRYGFLGTSDVSVLLSLGVTGALAAAMVAWSSWLFRTGHRLKP
jgi:ABC-2 type transport system permease protein